MLVNQLMELFKVYNTFKSLFVLRWNKCLALKNTFIKYDVSYHYRKYLSNSAMVTAN